MFKVISIKNLIKLKHLYKKTINKIGIHIQMQYEKHPV